MPRLWGLSEKKSVALLSLRSGGRLVARCFCLWHSNSVVNPLRLPSVAEAVGLPPAI
jgi:hypothetical protein